MGGVSEVRSDELDEMEEAMAMMGSERVTQ
jgi:hypothetical protein